MAESPTLRTVADFLWEWAGNKDWKKLLISKVIDNEGQLTNDQRDEAFLYLLSDLKVVEGKEALIFNRPSYYPSNKRIELVKLANVTGVNKLSKDEALAFAPNITIIYGQNGAGKTGYSRILKSLGYSWDQNKQIIPNIFEATENTTAKITYKVDGENFELDWNLNVNNKDLQNVSIFNNDCVKFSLGERSLLVSPIGFHLFDLVTKELGFLQEKLDAEIYKYPTQLLFLDSLNIGTPQYNFINSITYSSSLKLLDELTEWNVESQKLLDEKTSAFNRLDQELMIERRFALNVEIDELSAIQEKVKLSSDLINENNHNDLCALISQVNLLEKEDSVGLTELAKSYDLQKYNSKEFNRFIEAADDYIKQLDRENYPNNEDKCIYCLQDLKSKKSIELLSSYRVLLNNSTKEKLDTLKRKLDTIINNIKGVDTNFTLMLPSFGRNEKDEVVQPTELLRYASFINKYKDVVINDFGEILSQTFVGDLDALNKLLSSKKKTKKDELESLNSLIKDASAEAERLTQIINELKDRKYLSSKKAQVKIAINNHMIVNKLNKGYSQLKSTSLSKTTSQAREALIAPSFEKIFKQELGLLRKSNINIELNFGTSRGKNKVQQLMPKGYGLLEILSEGEQKAIALSEFLTELQLESSSAPIVFDDPVNSLDHHIIEDVSKRLMKLSQTRQVVVFTHSILLYNSFLSLYEQVYKQLDLEALFQNVSSDSTKTGVVSLGEERNSYTHYTKKINALISGGSAGLSEIEVVKSCYGHLRSAIELLVEDFIFKKTVKRYKKMVSLDRFVGINGSLIEKHKIELNEVYDRCCRLFDGHSSPEEIDISPKLSDFRTDYNIIIEIKEEFSKS